MAEGDGTREIVLGLVMTLVGFGSIFLNMPVYCCGFAIFGPILFIVGLVKAVRGPTRPAYNPLYYPPPYYPGPGTPQPPSPGVPTAPAPQIPPPGEPPRERKHCPTCGSDNRGDAKFCTSCGVPF